MLKYSATTHDIEVSVESLYLEQRSSLIEQKFVFTYFISITNDSIVPIQVLWREWMIQDHIGETKEVSGEGVVGLKPHINPGDTFRYQSFCVLKSFSGTMQGYFGIKAAGMEQKIIIPRFYLKSFLLN